MLHFEQCGGIFSDNKSPDQEEEWLWVDPSCQPGDICDLGFELTEELKQERSAARSVYADCELLSNPESNNGCPQYWNIDCWDEAKDFVDYECMMSLVNSTCPESDRVCYLGFLRGLCSVYGDDLPICDEPIFARALRKQPVEDGVACIPGNRWCLGFQEIFGGVVADECKPWNFHCAMYDYFVSGGGGNQYADYPLLFRMPKTTLTIAEND